MKLPEKILSLDEKMAEFDEWLTPQLQRIKDTDKFSDEVNEISSIIKLLSHKLNYFDAVEDCSAEKIRDAIVSIVEDETKCSEFYSAISAADKLLTSLFGLLFLTTGATDNNLKNHFSIKLKQDGVCIDFPEMSGSKNINFRLKSFGSTITSEEIAKKVSRALISSMDVNISINAGVKLGLDLRSKSEVILFEYISLILADKEDVTQFWVMCKAFHQYSSIDENMAICLLNPAVIFKVRGSVSASAGHLPENIFKDNLQLIGLEPGVDFNTTDVIVGQEEVEEDGKNKIKTRAYDFVLPYKREPWTYKIFIQSQFYAGDSGSVSHKVIDQTISSRAYTLQKYKDARFVEFLDGAGYFASLRTDLQHMMRMENTHSFFQVRSLWIRLRRELQRIGFITPIEIEHAIFRTNNGSKDDVIKLLSSEKYSQEEIERGILFSINQGWISESNDFLSISAGRKSIARRMLIIDIIANYGGYISSRDEMAKSILIPGYGSSYGLSKINLSAQLEKSVRFERLSLTDYTEDMDWLTDQKAIKQISLS